MLTLFLNFLAKVVANFVAAFVSDKRVDMTKGVIEDIEDAQRKNDVAFRDLGSVVERLRRDAENKSKTER